MQSFFRKGRTSVFVKENQTTDIDCSFGNPQHFNKMPIYISLLCRDLRSSSYSLLSVLRTCKYVYDLTIPNA